MFAKYLLYFLILFLTLPSCSFYESDPYITHEKLTDDLLIKSDKFDSSSGKILVHQISGDSHQVIENNLLSWFKGSWNHFYFEFKLSQSKKGYFVLNEYNGEYQRTEIDSLVFVNSRK